MLLTESIDRIVDWLEKEVCPQIELKLPNDDLNDEDYEVEYIHPTAWPLYVPAIDRLPPGVPAPVPSVCAQLMEGNDDLTIKRRRMNFRLCLACWNPGEHGEELYQTRPNAAALGGYAYYRATGAEVQTYRRNMSGWRDSFNFADLILREIENTEYIAGHRVVKEEGIKYGLFTEDGNIWDYYPYWHNWITFTLECGVTAAIPKKYENLL